jgi:hypothetical protein
MNFFPRRLSNPGCQWHTVFIRASSLIIGFSGQDNMVADALMLVQGKSMNKPG